MTSREYSEQRILAIPADVNDEGQVFYLNEDLGTSDEEHNGLSGEIEMAFDNGYGYAMMQFKEYLEKKKTEKSLGSPMEEYGMGFKDGIDYIIEEIIEELFGGE